MDLMMDGVGEKERERRWGWGSLHCLDDFSRAEENVYSSFCTIVGGLAIDTPLDAMHYLGQPLLLYIRSVRNVNFVPPCTSAPE